MTQHFWQDRLVTSALAVMETCGLALLVVTLLPPADWAGMAIRLLVVAVALIGTLAIARWLADSSLPWNTYDVAALGVMAAMVVLAEILLWRVRGSFSAAGGGTLWGIPPTIVAAGAAFVLWWRGFGLAQKGLEFATVSFNFRIGCLLVLLLAALNARARQGYVTALAAGFFLAGLLALAASRVEAKGREVNTDPPMGPYEASLMGTVGIATVAGGLLIGLTLTGGGISVLVSVLRPIAVAALEALILVAGWLAALFQPIADLLAALVENQQQERPTPTVLPGPLEMPEPAEPSTLSQLLGWLGTAVLVIIAAVILIELIVLLVLFLQKRQRRVRGGRAEYSAAAAGAGEDGPGRLAEIMGQIRDWAGLLLRYGLGPQLYTMLTVRTMYANMVRMAAARGHPRPPATTPYEYLPELRRAFPDADAELERLTNAYVGVHYGELPTGDDEMAQLRQAYDRIRQAAPPPGAEAAPSR